MEPHINQVLWTGNVSRSGLSIVMSLLLFITSSYYDLYMTRLVLVLLLWSSQQMLDYTENWLQSELLVITKHTQGR